MVGKYVESVKSRIAARLPHPGAPLIPSARFAALESPWISAVAYREREHRFGFANRARLAANFVARERPPGDHGPITLSI